MDVILEYKNGVYVKKTITDKRKSRTNNIDKIKDYINSLTNPKEVLLSDDIKIYYENGDTLTLKKYKKVLKQEKKLRLYRGIIDLLNEDVKVTKVNFINKEGLISLVLAATILFTATGHISKNKKVEKTVEVEIEIPELTIPKENFEIEQIDEAIDESNFSYETRVSQAIYLSNNASLPLASRLNEYALSKVNNLLTSTKGQSFFKYGEQYGVDPYLLVAIALNESSLEHEKVLPGSSNYNGYAYGIMQIEKTNIGGVISATNYVEDCVDSIEITGENLQDFDTNVKVGAMIFQGYIKKYSGNINIALQAYNYGYQVMDLLLEKYAKEINQDVSSVIKNQEDNGWMKYVKDMHDNPNNYISWNYKTYGNDNYINAVLSYYVGVCSKNVVDGNIIYTDLVSGKVTTEPYNLVQNII